MAASQYTFELIADRLCLDFCNTRSGRRAPPPVEHLPDYGELLRWAIAAGAATAAEARALELAARHHPREAARVVAVAQGLREAFYRLVTSPRDATAAADLATVNHAVTDALGHLQLAPAADSFELSWSERPLRAVLWPVARSMAELLTAEDPARVRRCAADTCAWVFFDGTRSGTRRWCSMADCGNRHKARRHYAAATLASLASRAEASPPPRTTDRKKTSDRKKLSDPPANDPQAASGTALAKRPARR